MFRWLILLIDSSDLPALKSAVRCVKKHGMLGTVVFLGGVQIPTEQRKGNEVVDENKSREHH